MSNYVHNYVFCSQEAFDYFRSLNDEIRFISACYDYYNYHVDANLYLMIFDTRGMEYSNHFIELFIYRYRDTKWYCVEENDVEEGCFCWNNNKVELIVRPLFDSLNYRDDYISIEFKIAPYRPVLGIAISEKEMILEYILQNKTSRYSLSEASQDLVWNFVQNIMKSYKYRRDGLITLYEFATQERNKLQREMSIYWMNHKVEIDVSNYDDKDTWQENVQNGGDRVFDDAIELVKTIIQQENGEENYDVEKRLINNTLTMISVD